jgi:hypothetical protein
VFVCFFGFCFCCFFLLFRYTLWMMILRFHTNFPLHLSVSSISSMCSATHRPLLGFFSHPHHDKLSTPPFNFGFQGALDRLFFMATIIRLVCLYVVYFHVIWLAFLFGVIYVLFLFPSNRFLFVLVIMLGYLSLDLLAECPSGLLLWSRPLGYGCKHYPDFQVKEDEF